MPQPRRARRRPHQPCPANQLETGAVPRHLLRVDGGALLPSFIGGYFPKLFGIGSLVGHITSKSSTILYMNDSPELVLPSLSSWAKLLSVLGMQILWCGFSGRTAVSRIRSLKL